MPNVLIASYYYYPYPGVGGIRAEKFAKYLPNYDWKSEVFTIDKKYYAEGISPETYTDRKKTSITRIAYKQFLNRFKLIKLLFPVFLLLHVKRNKKDVILISGSPFYPFLFTPMISFFTKTPVVLDFRDGWSVHGHKSSPKEDKGIINLARSIVEIIGLKYCKAVIFSTPVLKELYACKYTFIQEKCYTVHNGFDPDDFNNIQEKTLTDKKTLFIAGKFHFYTPEVVHYIFRYLQETENICLIYVGHEKELLSEVSEPYKIKNKLILLAYKPYYEVIQIAAGSDVCLLTTQFEEGLGTKVFDYIALKKIILSFVPTNSQIKKTFGDYQSVSILEPPYLYESVKESIDTSFIKSCKQHDEIEKYTRLRAAEDLSVILNSSLSL